MNSKVYKWCVVPQCKNTSIKTPNKVFVYVPHKKIIRYKWLNLARRDPTSVCLNSPIYFCEDHFDLRNDMENFMEYHLMGSVSQVRMKPGCIPTKFECQPDRRKRTSTPTERPYILNKQKKMLIEECKKDLEEKSNAIKDKKLGETSSGSSGYGGRITDTCLVETCDFITYLQPGMCVMADGGFKHLEQYFRKHGVQLLQALLRPPSVTTGTKLSKSEAKQTKQIASLRIHVERLIRRLREFHMLKPHACLNHVLVKLLDEVITIACGLVNLQDSLIK